MAPRPRALDEKLPCALQVWDALHAVPQARLLLQAFRDVDFDECCRPDGRAQDFHTLRAPHLSAELRHACRTDARFVPCAGLAGVHHNPCPLSQGGRQQVVDGPRPARLGHDVDVVEKREDVLPRLQLVLDLRQRVVYPQTEQQWHQWVALVLLSACSMLWRTPWSSSQAYTDRSA